MSNHDFYSEDPSDNEDDFFEQDFKSKTQVKEELKEITQFGVELNQLSMANLKKLPLTEEIIEAYEDVERMKGNEAKKRHFKRIGKLLREVDLEPIRLAYTRYQKGLPLIDAATKEPSVEEQWCHRLLDDNENPENFISEFPSCNRQQLRQLIRNAQKDKKNRSKLKQFVQQVISAS